MKTVIVIPLHRSWMPDDEKASLVQCAKIFGGRREIVFVAPHSLDCSLQMQLIPMARIERFDDSFFTSVSSYSHLLLTKEFYQRFSSNEFMLIYQPDAWVFCDELDAWCAKDYDYIGAPFGLKVGSCEKVIVGNGGFSLRKISAMLRVLDEPQRRMFPAVLLKEFFKWHIAQKHYLQSVKPLLRLVGLYPNTRGKYLEQIRHEKSNSEDVVFYFLSKAFTPDGLTMPDVEEAAEFSLNGAAEQFFQRLPFGAHAWIKGDPVFWKKYIEFEKVEL